MNKVHRSLSFYLVLLTLFSCTSSQITLNSFTYQFSHKNKVDNLYYSFFFQDKLYHVAPYLASSTKKIFNKNTFKFGYDDYEPTKNPSILDLKKAISDAKSESIEYMMVFSEYSSTSTTQYSYETDVSGNQMFSSGNNTRYHIEAALYSLKDTSKVWTATIKAYTKKGESNSIIGKSIAKKILKELQEDEYLTPEFKL